MTATPNPPHDPLPAPARADRWQPLRCGLLNIYRYDDEIFRFEQGRLLLRGDNGAGKSRVLALQLPFLLDGDVSPSRVEPDGDPAKRIEWHLLMGRWPERTGYTWIEFGRRTPEGAEEYLTLGCGLRAVSGHSGLHSRWFFITPRRVGRDLALQSADRRPHSRDRLDQALAGEGRIFTQTEEYRRAVDQSLFGLGPRYGRLVDLLIRLRRPKLSQKLDEEELSSTLSDALPTLPTQLIDEVAEAFRSLESDRDALRGFRETLDAVEAFLREYAVYARIAVRRRAAGVRSTHSRYEEAQRAVRDAERRVADATARLLDLNARLDALERDRAAAEQAARTLRESPEMRTAAELDNAGRNARAAEALLESARADAVRAALALDRVRADADLAVRLHGDVSEDLAARWRAAATAASDAGLAHDHSSHLGPELPAAHDPAEVAGQASRAEPALALAAGRQRDAIDLLRQREREVETVRRAWDDAESNRRRAADDAAQARDEERAARTSLDAAADAFRAACSLWHEELTVLSAHGAAPDPLPLADWIERLEGPNPWRLAAEDAHRRAVADLADRIAAGRQSLAAENAALAALDAERASLEQGRAAEPPVLAGRRSDRTDRPGAPLWRLCDFRPELPEPHRAGIEAALEASGLLDAWLLPDGRLVHRDTEDTFLLEPTADDPSPPSLPLNRWLVPAPDASDPAQRDLPRDRIEGVLSRIGAGPNQGLHWIDTDGSWRLGPVAGRWSKPCAAYLGEGSRAEARRRRLDELIGLIRSRTAIRDTLASELRRLEVHLDTAHAEWAAFPEDRPILEAGCRLTLAVARIATTFESHERAERHAAERRTLLDQAEARRDRDASDLQLSNWLGRLEELAHAVADYTACLSALWPTLRHWHASAERLALARRHQAGAEAELASRADRQRRAAEDAAAADSHHRTLLAMHGATVAVVLENLRVTEDRIASLRTAIEHGRRDELVQSSAKARAESDREHSTTERARHESERQSAIRSLEVFAAERLLAEAHFDLATIEPGPWAAHRAIEVARQIEPLLADTPHDDTSWRRRQDSIHSHVQELRDRLLARNHLPETHQLEDLILVRCLFQARSHTMTELREAFTSEILERERLLEAREREIIENHLLGEVAVELQRLVRAAEEWIASANRELASRPTSTGLRFRFVWEPALDGAFAGMRGVFLRTSELWSPEERLALTRFLQERIRAEQMAHEESSWRDHLRAALDYRRWHRFLIERQQDNLWRRLDKRTYGTGSGGEKALALTLPRFAAAAAHYRSARPDAPRLVMLDEAFAGIDPTMRSQCMGMLAQFDLDVVMTSELEWGCYPTVPGLAIHHLTAAPGIDAVASTLWIWNGRERRRIPAPSPSPPFHDPADPPDPDRDRLPPNGPS